MTATMRRYQGEADFWRVRAFLRELMLANHFLDATWHVARLDYWRWHVVANCGAPPIEEGLFLWEDGDQIVAVLNSEGGGDVHLQVHPEGRDPGLLSEMIATAEQHLYEQTDAGRLSYIFVDETDTQLMGLLGDAGYERYDFSERRGRHDLGAPIPDAPIPAGYTVRSLGDASELPSRSFASWRAFHADDPEDAYEGWEWYRSIQQMPLYRRDLDLVAVAPDGEIAAFCTVWYDDVTRTGYFEPVGTRPEHQRRGLGRAVLTEGLRRLGPLGAVRGFVGGYTPAATALYDGAGFKDADRSTAWRRELPPG